MCVFVDELRAEQLQQKKALKELRMKQLEVSSDYCCCCCCLFVYLFVRMSVILLFIIKKHKGLKEK